MLAKLIFLFFHSLLLLFVLRKVAQKIFLVDKPTERKQHDGDIPLVGGIAIFIALSEFLVTNPALFRYTKLYLLLGFILVLTGAIDDGCNINYKLRLVIQVGVSLLMVRFASLSLINIGDIVFVGNIKLGMFGWIITVLAVSGAINAFNMVDGIDGLLGVLSSITFGSLYFLLYRANVHSLAYFCLVLISIILPYILLNIGLFGLKRRVFMGDAGSMLIGYTVVWLLFLSSQEASVRALRPVTALWIIAVPLMDMVAIMMRRIGKHKSPFKPDRQHLHHIFQRIGFNSWQTLGIISVFAVCCSIFGIVGEIFQISEGIMFLSFLILFIFYHSFINHSFKITALMRLKLRK